ncbi:MAG TPA: Ig-like domain-containing protein [Parafilimonas sp.]|nr:Ig-like domain-containing protein [Parafilimonas sp.]
MKKYSFYFLIIFLITKVLFLYSCANIIPPGGGPKDTIPPFLIKAVPADSSLHFNANRITLTFSEYIQLDPQMLQSVITSPNPVQQPFAESHLQNVTIRLKDSLQPNTTYSINFGNAIKDVNEGNPDKNFTYVFSTGNKIDNGELRGKVQLAETGGTDSTLIVILHKDLNDSAIKKERPYYYARLDSGGNFKFQYLAHGTYNVFVLPNDYTKKYDDSTKMFAFLNSPVTIDSTPSQPLMLYAFNEFKAGKETSNTPTNPSNTPTKKKPVDTTKAIRFNTNLQKSQDLLNDFVISFQNSLQHYDSSKIILSDTNYKAVAGYKIVPDTSLKTFSIQYPWKENEYFKLIIEKDAFTDSSGKTLAKNDTINFKTASESEYGSIRLRFSNLDLTKNPVLQLLQNNIIVDSAALTSTEFYRRLYKPGEYSLRILYDSDKNMTWTPGNFELKEQPEIVVAIPRKITIKQNWDNEVNIEL